MYEFSCGIRNIPAYTAHVRTDLGISRKLLGKCLGIPAKEVYYIELGRIPSEIVVKRLKMLRKLAPALSLTSTIIIMLSRRQLCFCRYMYRRLSHKLQYELVSTYLLMTGRKDNTGQLLLSCCI